MNLYYIGMYVIVLKRARKRMYRRIFKSPPLLNIFSKSQTSHLVYRTRCGGNVLKGVREYHTARRMIKDPSQTYLSVPKCFKIEYILDDKIKKIKIFSQIRYILFLTLFKHSVSRSTNTPVGVSAQCMNLASRITKLIAVVVFFASRSGYSVP